MTLIPRPWCCEDTLAVLPGTSDRRRVGLSQPNHKNFGDSPVAEFHIEVELSEAVPEPKRAKFLNQTEAEGGEAKGPGTKRVSVVFCRIDVFQITFVIDCRADITFFHIRKDWCRHNHISAWFKYACDFMDSYFILRHMF